MKIIVTDVGNYWNHNNPALERYADSVIVICLEGKKVTDKYECIVSPYEIKGITLGMLPHDKGSRKYQALELIKDDICNMFSYRENILFLADNNIESLYPYMLLRDEIEQDNVHLWCMSPWKFETMKLRKEYREIIQDLSKVKSILYVDSNRILDEVDQFQKKFSEGDIHSYCTDLYAYMLPEVIYEIDNEMEYDECYYYDFGADRYVSTGNSFEKIRTLEQLDESEINFYVPRVDGKDICNKLKEMRVELAKANNINYEIVECPSTGPCAGTCTQCDKELKYLVSELTKIPEEKRKYPNYTIVPAYTGTNDNHMFVSEEEREYNKRDKHQLKGVPIPLMGVMAPNENNEK